MPLWLLKYLLPALAGIALIWGVHHHGYKSGKEHAQAECRAAQEAATAAHNAKLAEVEQTHEVALQSLQCRLDDALAHPVTRTIRVPIRAVCPAAQPSEAGVPEPPAESGYVDVVDAGYDSFRAWLLRYAAASRDGG